MLANSLLRAWLRYHKNATLPEVAEAKKRIAKLLEAT